MATWITPKEDWKAEDGVLNSDFNRIEGNIKYLKENASGALSATVTYYVSIAGNDSNDGLSASTAFATIQKAIDSIPKNLNDFFGHVVVAAGSYAGFSISDYYGGVITISNRASGAVVITNGVSINRCQSVSFSDMASLTINGNLSIDTVMDCRFSMPVAVRNSVYDAVQVSTSNVVFSGDLTVQSVSYAAGITAGANANIYVHDIVVESGTGTGLRAEYGGKLTYNSNPTNNATTKMLTNTGGRIYSGAQTSVGKY